MGKNKVVIEDPVTVAGITLIPLAGVSLNHWRGQRGVSYFSVKEPLGVVVVSPSTKRAFWITGEEVSLDQLITEVPGLKEVLEGI
jgi:hypothetical protein